MESAETLSKSRENYRIEVKNENGKWLSNKMINTDEDISTPINANSLSTVATTATAASSTNYFSNYDNIVNSEIETIETKSNDIDKHYDEFKQSNTKVNVDKSENKLNASINSLMSYSAYRYTDAVSYARTYDMSPNYSTYPGSATYVNKDVDCTDFTYQCVLAGGVPASSSWYDYSSQWVNVLGFYNYIINNGYGSAGTWTDGARSGDVLQFYNPSKSTWSHGVILTGGDSQGNWLLF